MRWPRAREAKLGVAMGETTLDRRVTLEPVYCLGLCHSSPAAMLDKHVFGMLDEAKLDALGEGGASVSARIFISRDSGALCVGAEEVARAFHKAFETARARCGDRAHRLARHVLARAAGRGGDRQRPRRLWAGRR